MGLRLYRSQDAPLSGSERPDRVRADQSDLGQNFVFSFQEGKEGDVFSPIRDRIRNGKAGSARWGDYLVYSLIDAIVDNYL